MLMPSESVSVANTTLSRPAVNASSTASFIGGTIPAWCAATPASSPASHAVVTEHVEVVVGERSPCARRRCAADRDALRRVGEPDPTVEALLDRLVATGPARTRTRSRAACAPRRAARRPRCATGLWSRGRRARAARAGPRPSSRATTGFGRSSPASSTNVGSRCSFSAPRSPTMYSCTSSTGRRSSMIGFGLAPHGLHPRRDLLGVRDRRRQRDDRDLARAGG